MLSPIRWSWVVRGVVVLAFAASINPINAQLKKAEIPSTGRFKERGEPEAEKMIHFLEERIKHDPEDFVSYNSLSNTYLQRLRETGDLQLLSFAQQAALKSLDLVPALTNPGGLGALARSEIAGHEFKSARDHALQLKSLSSGDVAYALLFDSSLELGDYKDVIPDIQEMERIDGGKSDATGNTGRRKP